MEDEVIQTTVEPTSDVVETNVTSAATEPVIDTSQSAAVTQPITPAPLTEKELAVQEINNRQIESYNTKGQGIKNWISTSYNYDATQAGTLWVAGKINDANTQMGFLEATLNEDLYSEMDLQKYFFDTNLATARAYAKEKKHETAYGFYRAAEEKALAEAQLTGWYMPAEAGYMLSQWIVADEQIKDPNISAVDKARAESVSRAVSGWFEANNITTRGIECLNSLYLKETIRHNQEMERLQEDANAIQKMINDSTNAANAANYELALAKYNFQLAEEEKGMGFDLNDDGIIGHTGEDAQRFGYYTSQKDWALNNMSKAMSYWGSDKTRNILGTDFKSAYNSYETQIQNDVWFKQQIENGYIAGGNMNELTTDKIKASELTKITDKTGNIKDATIKMIYDDNGQVRLYVFNKDGMAYQITDGSLELVSGKTINDILNEKGLTLNTNLNSILIGKDSKGNSVSLNIGKVNYGKYSQTAGNLGVESYPGLTQKQINTMNKLSSEKGYKEAKGYRDLKGSNASVVMYDVDKDGNKTYYAIHDNGVVKEITAKDIVDVHVNDDGTYKVTDIEGNEVTGWRGLGSNIQDDLNDAMKQSQLLYTKEDGTEVYMYENSDGSFVYMEKTHFVHDSNVGIAGKDYSFSVDLDPYTATSGYRDLYTMIPEHEVRKEFPNLDKVLDSKQAYANDIPETEEVVTSTPSEIGKELEGTATEKEKKEIESELANIQTNDVEVKPVNNNKSDSKKHSDAVELDFKDDAVIEDHNKYVTAFAEGEAVKQIQEIDEKFRQQLGATYL